MSILLIRICFVESGMSLLKSEGRICLANDLANSVNGQINWTTTYLKRKHGEKNLHLKKLPTLPKQQEWQSEASSMSLRLSLLSL